MTDFSPETIPDELRERPQWICWAESTRNGKKTKIPKNPDGSGENAKANDMATWGGFEQAVETAEKRDWGIGFVFSTAGPFVGVDLDSCLREQHGGPAGWLPSIEPFCDETFIEYSPSGTGLHVILKDADVPEWWTNQDEDVEGQDHHRGVEVYDDGRFFTFTGDPIDASASTVTDADGTLAEWLRDAWDYFNDEPPEPDRQTPNGPVGGGDSGSTDEITLDVHDVVSRSSFPCEERKGHPFHGSDTGANFMVDADAETFRCWRHDVTGNALHLLGIEQGIISCGEWDGTGLGNDTWREIFNAGRDAGYDLPEPSGDSDGSALDVVERAKEREQAATDGGTTPSNNDTTGAANATDSPETAEQPPEPTGGKSLQEQIDDILLAYNAADDMEKRTVIHRGALTILDEHHFVHPPENSKGWRSTLYRYNDDVGIYEPDGERFLSQLAERLLGDFLTNQQVNELVGKVKRLSGVEESELETPAYRLVVGNGILDFRTGDLDDHTPDEYHRTRIDVDYRPEAECPRIDEFFHEIVQDDDVDTLYRLAAHSLYKEYAAEKAAMLLGDGQNGKSVFLSLLEEFLGSHNVSHRSLQDLDGERFAANNLQGKLANVHPDMGDETVRDLGAFKKLTGRDIMTADVKYEKPINFRNYATLIFAANRMPAMDEDTHALWRRWIYLNFPYTFREDDPEAKDPTPKRVLMRELTDESELEGLLARCADEIQAWWEGRDWYPDTMSAEAVRKKMKRASEPVYDFAHVCLRETDDGYVEKSKVRDAYRQYAREEGLPAQADNVFGEKLLNIGDIPIEDGQRRQNGQRVRVYDGVELSPRGREVLGLDTPDDEQQSDLDDGGPAGRADQMLAVVRDLETDDSGVTKAMAVGRASTRMSMDLAGQAWDKLKERGDIYAIAEDEYRTTE